MSLDELEANYFFFYLDMIAKIYCMGPNWFSGYNVISDNIWLSVELPKIHASCPILNFLGLLGRVTWEKEVRPVIP